MPILLMVLSAPCSAIDPDLLAHQLLKAGRAAEAAEIFTDPSWKGVALYRSEQWWRAAEAFVRADDPLSAYNLGNCYVKLGYHALALEAYLRALDGDPELDDARHNASIMRSLLASDDDASERGGRSASEDEIERLESEQEPEQDERGSEGDGEGAAETDRQDSADAGAPDGAEGSQPTEEEAAGARSAPDTETPDPQAPTPPPEDGEASGSSVDGLTDDAPPATRAPAGQNVAADERFADDDAIGLRTRLEAAQATEQWLNRIEQDPMRYLEKHMALELKRRRASGHSAPDGAGGW